MDISYAGGVHDLPGPDRGCSRSSRPGIAAACIHGRGDIAVRFLDPVLLTAQLLDELFHGAGCSSGQIELLTGQPQAVVRASSGTYVAGAVVIWVSAPMAVLAARLRAAARHDFWPRSAEYRACGSRGDATSWKGDPRFGSVGWRPVGGASVDQSFPGGASPLTVDEALNKVGRPWQVNQGGVLGSGRS